MPEHLRGVLYTAVAVVEGGREDHDRSLDGRLDADLSPPESMGGSGEPGTNPEELFAVGYAARLQSPPLSVATGRKLDASALYAPRLTTEQAACGISRSDGST